MKYLALLILLFHTACSNYLINQNNLNSDSNVKSVLFSDIKWEPLNPKRGNKSPKAGTLYGDLKDSAPTGFLVEFLDGFKSPPHIHNVSYRGIVISGLVHNDDPAAKESWMPQGSFWTQPAGENHITAAKGEKSLAYIEIDKGPYLVHPAKDAFDNREKPINVHNSNIIWTEEPNSSKNIKVAYLWQTKNNLEDGKLFRIPNGFNGQLLHKGSNFNAVIIAGKLKSQEKGNPLIQLEPGSYYSSKGDFSNKVSCSASQACLAYVRSTGKIRVLEDDS